MNEHHTDDARYHASNGVTTALLTLDEARVLYDDAPERDGEFGSVFTTWITGTTGRGERVRVAHTRFTPLDEAAGSA